MNLHIQEMVKKHYGKIPQQEESAYCGCYEGQPTNDYCKQIGYSVADISSAPSDSNFGLGCGNPLSLLEINPGDTVLDLGSGAGFDCFLAARKVGPDGLVIGIDMTPEMIQKANENKEKVGLNNIEFKLGNIENLPLESNSIDLIISNCVINLSPEKPQVFREAFRVLKTGGVLTVSDIVLRRKLPRLIQRSIAAYVGCISGASKKDIYLDYMKTAGFESIEIVHEQSIEDIFPENDPTIQKMKKYIPLPRRMIRSLSGRYAASIQIKAKKPAIKTAKKFQPKKDLTELVPITA